MLVVLVGIVTLGSILEALARMRAHREAKKTIRAVREGRDCG
jgi:hypothetical protein